MIGGFRSWIGASRMSNHSEELPYNETVCLWMKISTLPGQGLSTLVKELGVDTRMIQSAFNELSPSVPDRKM